MDRLRRMAMFARVVEAGSISAAARELGMSPSAVSQQLRVLEQELGVVLLHRSTRRLTPTEAGQVFYEGCAAMTQAARQAETQLAALRDELVGELRVAVPAGFATTLVAGLAPLLKAHPRLGLRLFADDERHDLIASRIDLAIRVAHPARMADSSLIARPLAEFEEVLCASPDYLARCGMPTDADALTRHEWLLLTPLGEPQFLSLIGPEGQTRRIRLDGRVAGNSADALLELARAGLGICRTVLGRELAAEFASGGLRRVLPDWALPRLSVYAITPRRDAQPAKVLRAIDSLREALRAV